MWNSCLTIHDGSPKVTQCFATSREPARWTSKWEFDLLQFHRNKPVIYSRQTLMDSGSFSTIFIQFPAVGQNKLTFSTSLCSESFQGAEIDSPCPTGLKLLQTWGTFWSWNIYKKPICHHVGLFSPLGTACSSSFTYQPDCCSVGGLTKHHTQSASLAEELSVRWLLQSSFSHQTHVCCV